MKILYLLALVAFGFGGALTNDVWKSNKPDWVKLVKTIPIIGIAAVILWLLYVSNEDLPGLR